MAVWDKQVVVVRKEHWEEVEEHFLKNGQSVILGVKNDGWDVLDMEWECDYSGSVSTDEDAFGVLLDKDGSFKEVFKIVKRLIQKF